MSRFNELRIGDVLIGHVAKVLPFGAIVNIAEGVDGLLVGPDLPTEAGSRVTVRIADLDADKQRAKVVKA